MENPFTILQNIAEQRISEAMAAGEFDNLPGMGKPLPMEDLSNIPEELRMAYRLLKNANCLPLEIIERKEAASLAQMLENCPDELEKVRLTARLRLLVNRMAAKGRHMSLEENDEYYYKVLSRLEEAERKYKRKPD